VGCGPWSSVEPTGSNQQGAEDRLQLQSAGLNDVSESGLGSSTTPTTASYTCEIEVCGPGRYLGPSFATGCLQCPPGSYSVGGAVGGCTLCPPGTFGSSSGLTSPACSGNCSAGYACPTGSMNTILCAAGQYSLSGAGSCTLCPASTPFSSPGSGSCYSACPDATWSAWLDRAGVEGAHSCLKRIAGTVLVSWSAASALCGSYWGRGSHLLTSRQVRWLLA
jgi:hypothetical protein